MQALDLLVSASRLHLLRTVAIGAEAADEAGLRRSNNTFVSSVVAGVFWPYDAPSAREANVGAAAADPGVRVLRGEVYIPKGVKQSFAFPRFACRVSPFLFALWASTYLSSRHQIVHHRSSAAKGIWVYNHSGTRRTAPYGAHYGHNGQCTRYHPSVTDSTRL